MSNLHVRYDFLLVRRDCLQHVHEDRSVLLPFLLRALNLVNGYAQSTSGFQIELTQPALFARRIEQDDHRAVLNRGDLCAYIWRASEFTDLAKKAFFSCISRKIRNSIGNDPFADYRTEANRKVRQLAIPSTTVPEYELFIEELEKEFASVKEESIRNWKSKYPNKRDLIDTEITAFSFEQLSTTKQKNFINKLPIKLGQRFEETRNPFCIPASLLHLKPNDILFATSEAIPSSLASYEPPEYEPYDLFLESELHDIRRVRGDIDETGRKTVGTVHYTINQWKAEITRPDIVEGKCIEDTRAKTKIYPGHTPTFYIDRSGKEVSGVKSKRKGRTISRVTLDNLLNYSPAQYAHILANRTSDETSIELSEFLHMPRGKELSREDLDWLQTYNTSYYIKVLQDRKNQQDKDELADFLQSYPQFKKLKRARVMGNTPSADRDGEESSTPQKGVPLNRKLQKELQGKGLTTTSGGKPDSDTLDRITKAVVDFKKAEKGTRRERSIDNSEPSRKRKGSINDSEPSHKRKGSIDDSERTEPEEVAKPSPSIAEHIRKKRGRVEPIARAVQPQLEEDNPTEILLATLIKTLREVEDTVLRQAKVKLDARDNFQLATNATVQAFNAITESLRKLPRSEAKSIQDLIENAYITQDSLGKHLVDQIEDTSLIEMYTRVAKDLEELGFSEEARRIKKNSYVDPATYLSDETGNG
ncbi:hypothetical protein MMC06_006436 [Schaereria dolodes]|nr:hypothetical protein [Schaereria dolodes]